MGPPSPLSLLRHLSQDQYDDDVRMTWFQHYWWLSIFVCAIYVILVFQGKKIMKTRSPFSLRLPLTLWSSCLALFSIYGSLVTTTYVIKTWIQHDFYTTVCSDGVYDGYTGFWLCLFALSKAFELLDTFFIILRKKELIFLHWYHHVLTLFYCCYAYTHRDNSPGGISCTINFIVHAFMYSYYAVRASGRITIPKEVNVLITSLQIVQMAVNLWIHAKAYMYFKQGRQCAFNPNTFYLTMAMYASYLILFTHFYYQSYFSSKRSEKPKKAP